MEYCTFEVLTKNMNVKSCLDFVSRYICGWIQCVSTWTTYFISNIWQNIGFDECQLGHFIHCTKQIMTRIKRSQTYCASCIVLHKHVRGCQWQTCTCISVCDLVVCAIICTVSTGFIACSFMAKFLSSFCLNFLLLQREGASFSQHNCYGNHYISVKGRQLLTVC